MATCVMCTHMIYIPLFLHAGPTPDPRSQARQQHRRARPPRGLRRRGLLRRLHPLLRRPILRHRALPRAGRHAAQATAVAAGSGPHGLLRRLLGRLTAAGLRDLPAGEHGPHWRQCERAADPAQQPAAATANEDKVPEEQRLLRQWRGASVGRRHHRGVCVDLHLSHAADLQQPGRTCGACNKRRQCSILQSRFTPP